jgi:hypothetical protein
MEDFGRVVWKKFWQSGLFALVVCALLIFTGLVDHLQAFMQKDSS